MQFRSSVIRRPVAHYGKAGKIVFLANKLNPIADVDVHCREYGSAAPADILSRRFFAAGRTVLCIDKSKVKIYLLPEPNICTLLKRSFCFLNAPHSVLV